MSRGQRGQAALEVIATVPLMVVAVLVIVQLVGFVRAAIVATDDARVQLVRAGTPTTVVVDRRVRALVPGARVFTVRVRATTEPR